MQWDFSTAETENTESTSSGAHLQTTLHDNKSHLAEDDNDVINTVFSLEREFSRNSLAVLSHRKCILFLPVGNSACTRKFEDCIPHFASVEM